jgi:hypothetical protein
MKPEQFLDNYEPAVKQLAESTRQFLFKIIPAIKEEVDVPARMIGYSLGTGYKGMVCTLLLSKTGVKLGFYKGAELPDPEKLLEGSGKIHRYAIIADLKILKSKALKDLAIAGKKACELRMSGK